MTYNGWYAIKPNQTKPSQAKKKKKKKKNSWINHFLSIL